MALLEANLCAIARLGELADRGAGHLALLADHHDGLGELAAEHLPGRRVGQDEARHRRIRGNQLLGAARTLRDRPARADTGEAASWPVERHEELVCTSPWAGPARQHPGGREHAGEVFPVDRRRVEPAPAEPRAEYPLTAASSLHELTR